MTAASVATFVRPSLVLVTPGLRFGVGGSGITPASGSSSFVAPLPRRRGRRRERGGAGPDGPRWSKRGPRREGRKCRKFRPGPSGPSVFQGLAYVKQGAP